MDVCPRASISISPRVDSVVVPFSQSVFAHRHELAVMIRSGSEWLDKGVDEGHVFYPVRLMKTAEEIIAKNYPKNNLIVFIDSLVSGY